METLKNPGINFPVSGLMAIIATGMLLYFNSSLSKTYIPIKFFDLPRPVSIENTKPPEPVKPVESVDLSQEPLPLTQRNTPSDTTNHPETILPISRGGTSGPGTVEIHKFKLGIHVQIPHASGYFTPNQVDQRPRILKPVTPEYPYQATINGIEGRVVLRFIVDENGRVQNPEVVKADPERVFEQAALAAIVKYKFIPAKIGGENVKCVAVLPIGFKLN